MTQDTPTIKTIAETFLNAVTSDLKTAIPEIADWTQSTIAEEGIEGVDKAVNWFHKHVFHDGEKHEVPQKMKDIAKSGGHQLLKDASKAFFKSIV